MTPTPAISRFTPSLMEHALLERLFVARHDVLDDVMNRVQDAAAGEGRNHTLLVGPRGAGKTHLVTLAYHRTRGLIAAGARLQVSWLPEDPWTLITYRHLLAAVVDKLEPAVEDPPKDADALERLIVERAREHGPVVVFVENLDQILDNLGEIGQQRLRHLLQAERSLLLVASTTRLDRSLSDQASPFYGFFTTTRLEPFDVPEAATMLTRIAEEKGDADLVRYLAGEEAGARLRTVDHLAGGQPRMWATLASALTVEGLRDLVDLLLARFDDLTPYYQEQLARLAPQQRLVVAELAEADRPINVKELAERLDLDQRSVGKTMVELVDRGWAAPTTSPIVELLDRRKTFYELAEPMARLAFQIKESRGEPLKLIVEFLKYWFDPAQITEAADTTLSEPYVVQLNHDHEHDSVLCVARRLSFLPTTPAPMLPLLAEVDDALRFVQDGDPEPLFRLAAPVRGAIEALFVQSRDTGDPVGRVRTLIHLMALGETHHHPDPSIDTWAEHAEDLADRASGPGRDAALLIHADWLGRRWTFAEAMAVLGLVSGSLAHERLETQVRSSLARSLCDAGRPSAAVEMQIDAIERARALYGDDAEKTNELRHELAGFYWTTGQDAEAKATIRTVAAARERLLGRNHPRTILSRHAMVASGAQTDDLDETIRLLEEIVTDTAEAMGRDHPSSFVAGHNLAVKMAAAGRTHEAADLLRDVIARATASPHLDSLQSLMMRASLAQMLAKAGSEDEARALARTIRRESASGLGIDHPTRTKILQRLQHLIDQEP